MHKIAIWLTQMLTHGKCFVSLICSKTYKMATSKFYLRSKGKDCAIQMQFSISRTLKMRTSTGLISNSNVWSDKTDLPTLGKNASDKNLVTKLQNLSTFVLEAYNVDFANGVNFSNEWLKSKINKYFERENPITEKEDDNFFSVYLKNNIELRKLDSRTKKTTDQKFVQLQTKFTDFEKTKKKKYLISEIDKKFMLVFRKHLIDKFKIMESTANRSLKNLKTVLIDARDNGKTINHQINNFSIDTVPATKVFLNFDEIKKIKESTIIGSDLIHAKDWLIMGCYTGQRVSDLLRMTKEMVFTKTDSNGESFQFIELTQQKTGKEVTIPLHDEVLKIINKYDGNFPPTFGKTGDSKFALFNRYIKKVCEISKINDIVKGKVYDSKEKRNEIKETDKWRLTSSHICRRSFATNFYGDKRFTTPQIMAITGHGSESVFLGYIGKSSSDHAMTTAKTFKEIENQKIAN